MATDQQKLLKKVKMKAALKDGIFSNNPVTVQVLGICSCLAVTNKVESAIIMGCALIFVLAMSNLFVSLIRSIIPLRIRMIAEVAIIATFVIFFDQFLKAFYWEMSKQLGPYVGLIITNCIVMGRAEAFATQNPPLLSIADGFSNGIGYAVILILIALCREILGSGELTVFGYQLFTLAELNYKNNLLLVMAPGAFISAGFIIWILNSFKKGEDEEENK